MRAFAQFDLVALPRRALYTDDKIDPVKRRDYLETTEPSYKLPREATSMPNCVFERDWTLGPNLHLTEIRKLRRLADVALLRAEVARELRDWPQMFDELGVVLRASGHFNEPLLLSALSQSSFRRRALTSVMAALNHHPDDRELIRMTRGWLAIEATPTNFQQGFTVGLWLFPTWCRRSN